MPACSDTDNAHLARAIELAHNGTGEVKPNPVVGAVIARDGEVLGEGWHERYGAAHAEVNAIEACGLADLKRRDPVRVARAVLSRGQDAALHRRDPAGRASGGSWSPPMIPPRRPRDAGSAILRDEGIEVVVADGELAARARLLNQAFRKHARTGRPWVLFKSAMTLDGKVATRSGDSKWISGEESRDLAHRWRASVDAVVVGIGTALADDPQLTARPDGTAGRARAPAPARRVRLARAPAGELAARRGGRRRSRSRSSSRAPPPAPTPTRSKPPACRCSSPLARTSPRACARRSTSSVRWASPRCCSRAGRIWPARSSTRARSTKSGCSWRRCCSAGAPRATRSRARASSRSPRPCARSRSTASASARTCLISARAARVVSGRRAVFTGLIADLGTVDGARARRRGRHARRSPRGSRTRARRGRLGRRQRRLPDGHRGAATGASAPRRCRDARALVARRAWARARPVNLELALRAGERLGGHIVQGHVDGTGAVARCARRGSRACSRSRSRSGCCATWSRRARSRSTASA